MTKKASTTDEIKGYSLKEGSYNITVKVLEANDLIPKNKKIFGFGGSSTCTSQVEVEVHRKKKKSKIIKENSSPVFNQGWTFAFKGLKLEELQDIVVLFTVYDKSSSLTTSIIGSYELDLSSIYFQLHHEYFHTWITLTDPTDEVEGPTGYLFVNISALGPGDEPYIHDIEDAKKAGSGREKALIPAKVQQTGHQIEINIYRAENLPCLDSNLDSIDAYVVVKYGGIIGKSSVIVSRNPEWNECIKVQCMLPSQSKQLTIAIYDKDIGLGQLKVNLSDFQYKKHIPKWGNLYGAPSTASGKAADFMNFYGETQGSHYRGRLLYSCSSYPKAEPKTSTKQLAFSFPNNPIPQTKMRSYLLWVDVLEGSEIPERYSDVILHASMGPYMLSSSSKANIGGQVNWFESLEERKVVFPEDISQIPDIIFYVADDNREDRRISFNRIKASKILRLQKDFLDQEKDHQTVLVELKEDRSLDLVKDDEFSGFLILKVSLFNFRPNEERIVQSEAQLLKNIQDVNEYQLRVQIYQGRGLPPADATGGCDPFVKVKCAGKVGLTKAKQKTLNPGWFESVNIDKINLPSMKSLMETKYPTKGMFLTVYDCDENSTDEQINNVIQKLDPFNLREKISTLYSRIVNKKEEETESHDSGHEPLQNSKVSNLQKSRIGDIQTGQNWQGEDQINKSLNDSGIIISDADKIDKDLLGRLWIPLEATHVQFKVKNSSTPLQPPQILDILYRRPKWYPIKYDATGEYTGQVLLSYCLIPQFYSDIVKTKPSLFPTYDTRTICFFLIGVREIEEDILGKKVLKIQASLDVSGDSSEALKTQEMKVVNSGGNANQYIELQIQVPRNKSFEPVIDVFLWNCSHGDVREFLGYGSLSFKDIPFLKYQKAVEENNDVQSEMSLIDCLREAIYLEKKMGADQAEQEDKVKSEDEIIIKDRKVYQREIPVQDQNALLNENEIDGQYPGNNYLAKKQLLEELGEVPEEDLLEDEDAEGQDAKRKTFQARYEMDKAEFTIKEIKEKTFDNTQIIISPAYQKDKNEEEQRLLSNLPARPLNLSKRENGAGKILDLKDKSTYLENEFIMAEPFVNHPLFGADQSNVMLTETNDQRDLLLQENPETGMSHHDLHSQHSNISEKLIEIAEPEDELKISKKEVKIIAKKSQNYEISTFNPPESLTFSVKSHSKRSLHYEDFPKEGRIIKEEVADSKLSKFVLTGKLLSLFKKSKGMTIIEYEDVDTDEDEDLDITPEWKKDREVFLSEFEDKYKPSKKLTCISLKCGQSRGAKKDLFSIDRPQEPQQIAQLKCLFLDPLNPSAVSKVEELKVLLKERPYFIRVYVTRGKQIGGEEMTLDSYLIFKLGDKIINCKTKTLCENTNNPEYYVTQDFECKLPGSAILEVQVWNDCFGSDEMIGKTILDMENRLFTGKWLQFDRKPFENRNIFAEGETISKGNLEMWVELIPKSVIRQNPPIPISPPPRYEMELRVIVWETKDCVFKDEAEKCNDVFVRMGLQNKPDKAQETDIHWRCRSNGSFNWRMKFKQHYPLNTDEYGGDKLFVQLLDKDIIAADDIIGSCVIDLNTHKMIDKCIKRQKAVPIQLRELNRQAKFTDKIWYQVYNPQVRDKANQPIVQGQVCLSIELVPKKYQDERPNGVGRDAPNNFPPLSEPTGRMKFDLLHPLDFIKTLIGPDLYKRICGAVISVLCLLFCLGFGWILLSQVLASAIVK